MKRAAVIALLALGLAGCGGGHKKVDAPVLPPANPQALNKMVQGVAVARESGGRARAIDLLNKALAQDPKLWEAHYNLGLLLAETGDLGGAEKHLADAALLAPNTEDVAVALGEVRRRRGDYKGAADALERFVKAFPKAVVARVVLVSALRESGRIDEAIKQAREVLVRRSSDPNALTELAAAHLDRGEVDTAELLIQEALKADPDSAVATRTAGLIALKRGDDAVAFKHFARASELDPKETAARLNVGTVLLEAGIYERAATEFRGVIAVEKDNTAAAIGLAASLRGTGKRDNQAPWSESEKLLKGVLEREPKNLAATYNLAILYSDFMQRPGDAKPLFKRFLDDAPKSHPSRPEAEKKLAGTK